MTVTFDITTKGFQTGAQNAAATKAIKITGKAAGGKVRILASNEDANYGEIQKYDFYKFTYGQHVWQVDFPAGTYFNVAIDDVDSEDDLSLKVVMW